jgi:hypothetical protein
VSRRCPTSPSGRHLASTNEAVTTCLECGDSVPNLKAFERTVAPLRGEGTESQWERSKVATLAHGGFTRAPKDGPRETRLVLPLEVTREEAAILRGAIARHEEAAHAVTFEAPKMLAPKAEEAAIDDWDDFDERQRREEEAYDVAKRRANDR